MDTEINSLLNLPQAEGSVFQFPWQLLLMPQFFLKTFLRFPGGLVECFKKKMQDNTQLAEGGAGLVAYALIIRG